VWPRAQFAFRGNGNWVAGIKGNSVKGRQTGKNGEGPPCVECRKAGSADSA
jgi:hypothetical protein